jgi:uncharacterized protein YjbJ (UPF0337 family)
MKWMHVEAQWPALQQRARRHWFHLTQGDVERISGTREELIDRVRERYEFSREQAEKEVDAWVFFLTAPDVTPSEVTTAPHDFPHQGLAHHDTSDDDVIHDVMSHPDLRTEAPTVPDDVAPSMAPNVTPEAA